tara:strand:+ start:1319 stop:2071 length:753 start_codon:yes stop_codon:yes gene_type:complete
MADIHFGVEDPVALNAVHEWTLANRPDGVIVAGDLTQRGKRSEFEAARTWIDSIPGRKLVVAGNHDTPLLNMWSRTSQPFSRHDRYFSDLAKPLEFEDVRVSGINTARGWQARKNWAEGVVNLQEMEAALDSTNDRDTQIDVLVCHHPFLPNPAAPLKTRTYRGKRASEKMIALQTDLLLTGHVHVPGLIRHTHGQSSYASISAGTLSLRTRQHKPSFNLICIEGQAIEMQIYTIENGRVTLKENTSWLT